MEQLQEKKGYAEIIEKIADDLLGFVSMEVPEECAYCVSQIDNTVKNLLDFDKPKVMVYGIYNSGKSTLINALMRQEVAEMADRPMTNQISEFDRNEYVLVDSPGIDAPIAHEMVTNEFLNKCHIILFVISSKGGFEGAYNYHKMAELIKKDIPFIIVLNERGYAIDPEWTPDEKALRRAEHEQELKNVQYKIIDNLIRVTGDKDITQKYEVYVLNAKKALTGIQKNHSKLYEASKVDILDQRIIQLVQSGSAVKVLRQPITNLKFCFDYIESHIAQQMQEGSEHNFATKIDILRQKQENLKDEMRILIRQATNSHIDQIAAFYVANNAEAAEGEEYAIFQDIEDKYTFKLTEILTYIERSFKDIDGIRSMTDWNSNLEFSLKTKDYSTRNIGIVETEETSSPVLEKEKKGFWDILDIFKSRKKREEERFERLEREAALINEHNQNKLNEQMRARQEARQVATSDMFELQNLLISTVNAAIVEKFQDITSYIQSIDCKNKQLRDEGQKKLRELADIRKSLADFENKLF